MVYLNYNIAAFEVELLPAARLRQVDRTAVKGYIIMYACMAASVVDGGGGGGVEVWSNIIYLYVYEIMI